MVMETSLSLQSGEDTNVHPPVGSAYILDNNDISRQT